MRLSARNLFVAVSMAAAGLVLGATGAMAVPGGDWASSSAPITVNYAGYKPVGYAYGTFQGEREDQGRGSRLQDWSATKARAGYAGGDRGTYVKHQWWSNGNYCYTSSYSVSKDSYSTGTTCNSEYWSEKSTNQSGSNATSTWKYWETWNGLDPSAESGKVVLTACWNVVSAFDSCGSANHVRGSRY